MAKIFHALNDPALVDLINSGAIGVIPTDTVYGLVGKASSELAIQKLYSVKEREHKAGTIIAASIAQLEQLGFPAGQLTAAQKYWPGSVSVVIDATLVPDYLKADRDSLAVRVPSPAPLHDLLCETGALMTTSANHPGKPTATSLQSAIDYFGDAVDFYVDAGNVSDRPLSTIIGFNATGGIIVIRDGAVKIR